MAYPGDQTNAMSVVVARDSFLSALNDPELEEKVRGHEPKDLDEACRIAQRLEVIHNTVHASTAGQRAHQARQVTEVSETSNTQEQGEGNEGRRRPPRQNRGKQQAESRNVKVAECGEEAAKSFEAVAKAQADLVKELVQRCADKDRDKVKKIGS